MNQIERVIKKNLYLMKYFNLTTYSLWYLLTIIFYKLNRLLILSLLIQLVELMHKGI